MQPYGLAVVGELAGRNVIPVGRINHRAFVVHAENYNLLPYGVALAGSKQRVFARCKLVVQVDNIVRRRCSLGPLVKAIRNGSVDQFACCVLTGKTKLGQTVTLYPGRQVRGKHSIAVA